MKKLTQVLCVGILLTSFSTLALATTEEDVDLNDIEMEIEHELTDQLQELSAEEDPDQSVAQREQDIDQEETAQKKASVEDILALNKLKAVEEAKEVKEAKKTVKFTKVEKQKLKKKVAKRLHKKYDRQPASVVTQGFKRLTKDCPMHLKPDSNSQQVLHLKRGKKLWVESQGLWVKGFRRKGEGYIPASCF